MEVFNIALRGIFIDNMIFAYYLGMCSFLAVSKKVETAFGLGLAVVFVLTLTVHCHYAVHGTWTKQSTALAIDSLSRLFCAFVVPSASGIDNLPQLPLQH